MTLLIPAANIWPFVAIPLVLVGLVFLFTFFYFLNVWIRALASKAHVGILTLIGMKLRHVDPGLIVEAVIRLKKAGLSEIETDSIEAHLLAGGDVLNVVNALIAADKAGIPLDFKRATGIDLAGRDVLDAVKLSVLPRVIDCPDPAKGRNTIDAVAKDGIQLRAKARVTVRANLERLVGGATEETIIARVGEGIVTTIGSAASYATVLENPDLISTRVLEKGLDSGTAYEILSIDIADVDVGENIGAKLQADQAEADMRVAQARAEVRRAQAVAVEQEMKARVQEMQAKVVGAQAEVPLAMAAALRDGNLGVLDYYRMENLKADTEMRSNIVGEEDSTVQ
ncbi:MAG: flotillin-like protein FloA [Victivallales bacterium]|nr:flotillin-like protein FloA [Victivallales bacterium]MBT7300705.1 flotillin-like protein FloA [Victivallales bacterium]